MRIFKTARAKLLRKIQENPGDKRELDDFSEVDKLDGNLDRNSSEEKKLPKTVLEDDEAQAEGKLLNEAIDRGISFNADMMFNNFVSQYKNVKKLYGETFIRELTGYDSRYLDRNAKIPEFQRRLKDVIKKKLDEMKKKKLIDYHSRPTDEGMKLASVTLCINELDNITPKDLIGEKIQDKESHYGPKDQGDYSYKMPKRFKDIAIKKSIRAAIRRGHKNIEKEDFRSVHRKSKGSIHVVYGIDCSGSMKGEKLNVAKKSGIALAYKAINQHDKVGLIAFNSEIVKEIPPMSDFDFFMDNIVKIQGSKETNLVHAIERAIDLFPDGESTKHFILLTDAVPTVGATEQTLQAVAKAKAASITISVVGIKLTEGLDLAENIVETSEGKLYVIKNLSNMDSVILEDYYGI